MPGECLMAHTVGHLQEGSPVTGISNLNLVVQQGGSAQQLHHIKQQSAEYAQVLTAQQQAIRDAEVRGKVPESEDADRLHPDKDKSRDKNKKHSSEEENQKKNDPEEKELTLTGKLLDTVA